MLVRPQRLNSSSLSSKGIVAYCSWLNGLTAYPVDSKSLSERTTCTHAQSTRAAAVAKVHSQRHLGNTLRLKAPLTPSGLRPRTHSTRLETTDTLRLQEHELAAVVGLPADAEPRPDPRYVDPLDEADAPKAAPKKVAGRVKLLQAIQRATAEVYPIMATLSHKLLLPTRSPFKFFCLRAASLRRYPMRTMGWDMDFPEPRSGPCMF